MNLFKYNKYYNFMSKKNIFLFISFIFVFISYFMLFFKGLNFGVDFAGGTLIQIKYDKKAPIFLIRDKLNQNSLFQTANVTEFGSESELIIKLKTSSKDLTNDIGDITRELLKDTGSFEIRRIDLVGPKVGKELREKGLMATILAILGILVYVSFRFEWRFAFASIFALVHDISIVLGALVIFNIDINLDILAAILTILGYSLNDTIIVFDRIRESLLKVKKNDSLKYIINYSISKTVSRTFLTSLTTFFVVLTLYLFGGEIINGFSFALLIGVIVGTYSSIFIASPFLILFGFSVLDYRKKLAKKESIIKEKNRLRNMYDKGTI